MTFFAGTSVSLYPPLPPRSALSYSYFSCTAFARTLLVFTLSFGLLRRSAVSSSCHFGSRTYSKHIQSPTSVGRRAWIGRKPSSKRPYISGCSLAISLADSAAVRQSCHAFSEELSQAASAAASGNEDCAIWLEKVRRETEST